eukprot:CAMPEP_0197576562 /NCGR_PEP_ID=MMETSP1326-20131121/1549_1 /TAXON_ID=1155430 /ORGANISM="Genus nov. species nov., Strain RCC2288" /LENGTH=45 /DNA_ID= /DNA_START= /DNA_END= /DNA_ORIENTATION=
MEGDGMGDVDLIDSHYVGDKVDAGFFNDFEDDCDESDMSSVGGAR